MSQGTPLTDRERRLVQAAAHLVEGLAASMARRFRTIPLEDFVSVGSAAAVTAARNFDPERGTTFESFAYQRIRGSMLRDTTREAFGSVHNAINRGLREYDADAAPPSDLTLEEALEDSPENARLRTIAWLRRQAAEMAVGTLLNQRAEHVPSPHDQLERETSKQALHAAIAELDEEERYFVRRYYVDDATLDDIAVELKVVKRTASRIHERVKGKLEKKLRKAEAG
jgi:RNA polymerase sigma factor (sigma-70 family)